MTTDSTTAATASAIPTSMEEKQSQSKENEEKLLKLKEVIDTLGNDVRTLKTTSPDSKDKIKSLIDQMLAAKSEYAQLNNGIGVDGKPVEDKKKKKKGGGKKVEEEQDPNSVNAKKKAAKKAEKAAKKAQLKAANKGGTDNSAKEKSVQPEAVKKQDTTKKVAKTPTPSKPITMFKPKVQPLELKYNPNLSLTKKPILSIATALLLNEITSIKLTPDPKLTFPTSIIFGLPNANDGEMTGDISIALFLIKYYKGESLSGCTVAEEVLVTQWMEYCMKVSSVEPVSRRQQVVMQTLEHALANQTFVALNRLTIVDLLLLHLLDWPVLDNDGNSIVDESNSVKRWRDTLSCHPCIQQATQLLYQTCNKDAYPASEKLLPGMSLLEGAIPGQVVTRFPPEPSGYLHVGHAKAVLLNNYYARFYNGRLIVRMDDTNPSKEKQEYHDAILHDLSLLSVIPDVTTYTSDYFETMRGYAMTLLKKGIVYMDDTQQDEMQKERMERVESKHRNQSVEDALKYFTLMESGKEEGKAWCCRAKIDMSSNNGTMRDPVIYRQNILPHPRTGTKYKAYPTYDFACPIVDSLEGVTHALRTTEYNDRDEQYAYFQRLLQLQHRTRIHSFARMNFQYTELSKRKLAYFVDEGLVDGWDDPRFPTVRGVIRRGVHIPSLTRFICSQGASRRITNMEWNKFWAENKKDLDLFAKRYMAIDAVSHVDLTIENVSSDVSNFISTNYLPKDDSAGKRVIPIGPHVILESADVEGIAINEQIVLMRWGVFQITSISPLKAIHIPDGNVKTAKRKLSWMAKNDSTSCHHISISLTEFDNIISKDKLEEGDDFKDYINPNTMATSKLVGDASLKLVQQGEIIQLERRGYFRCDRVYVSENKPLMLFMIPDGKKKSMGGVVGKLAHH